MYKLKVKEYKKEVKTYIFNNLQEVTKFLNNMFNCSNLYQITKNLKEYNTRLYLTAKKEN